MFAGATLGEESVEAVVRLANAGVSRHHPVWMDPVLQTVQLPAYSTVQYSTDPWQGFENGETLIFYFKFP